MGRRTSVVGLFPVSPSTGISPLNFPQEDFLGNRLSIGTINKFGSARKRLRVICGAMSICTSCALKLLKVIV